MGLFLYEYTLPDLSFPFQHCCLLVSPSSLQPPNSQPFAGGSISLSLSLSCNVYYIYIYIELYRCMRIFSTTYLSMFSSRYTQRYLHSMYASHLPSGALSWLFFPGEGSPLNSNSTKNHRMPCFSSGSPWASETRISGWSNVAACSVSTGKKPISTRTHLPFALFPPGEKQIGGVASEAVSLASCFLHCVLRVPGLPTMQARCLRPSR